jgi:hypothetical protein
MMTTEQELLLMKWPELVHYAVYDAPDADNWIEERLEAKGRSTVFKLNWIVGRWANAEMFDEGHDLIIEWVRCVNYLAALLRGGFYQASMMYEDLKEKDPRHA